MLLNIFFTSWSFVKVFFITFFSSFYFSQVIKKRETVYIYFSIIGGIFTITQLVGFLFPNNQIITVVKTYYILIFILFPLMVTLFFRRPVLSVKETIPNRDVDIEIKIGDLFNTKGARIIGTNTTFDTNINNGTISPKSLQGQFTQQFYTNHEHLYSDIISFLSANDCISLNGERKGNYKRYPMGTIVPINKDSNIFYFVAINDMNEYGVVCNVSFENILDILGRLWQFFRVSRISYETTIVLPLLGTGMLNIPVKREKLIREIIKSFLASISEGKNSICSHLVILISPNDYKQYNIDLLELKQYLFVKCIELSDDLVYQSTKTPASLDIGVFPTSVSNNDEFLDLNNSLD